MSLTISKITDELSLEKAFHIREQVFVKEQNVAAEEEYDEFETMATHFIVQEGEQGVGTARWRYTNTGIKLERFAVLKPYRSHGVGSMLVKAVLEDVLSNPSNKNKTIYLHAQVTAVGLYGKFGFEKKGELFLECEIEHYLMQYNSGEKF
ncbi:GNAT family N-acetyltransferase [uncultured Cyclobacterium sp.]|uniref:GNAT family N-acetyltransferase n=1 Tax=uncultured Cyclobacterium sp. TaxID=453820 RepID=UPI0030EF330E|tara:strand:- start:59874 stop:60323 length:450 start_codon:yes stop_codon:yes gene_type:complete